MKTFPASRFVISLSLLTIMVLMPLGTLRAQDPVTGAIEGYVFDSASKAPISGALVQFINTESGAVLSKRTNEQGYYRQGLLPPGEYRIRASMQGYVTPQDQLFTNWATKSNTVMPPIYLPREAPAVAVATPEPSPAPGQPAGAPTPSPQTTTSATTATGTARGESVASEMNLTDARRVGAYTDREVSTLPLGGTTLTRSFDELGLLVPGVAPPPETPGSVAGPGVGPGVGSAGQFAVNGIRSRANNFTVDGSDNNDEDIGVRRQGFFALVPQPVESIKEFQITTLLAPAQYGRNIGAQVNAVSKSGGNQHHGTIYGFFNSSQLNAADAFDMTSGNTRIPLQARTPTGSVRNVFLNGAQAVVSNNAGNQESFTLGQGGLVFGGPLVPSDPGRANRGLFFFVSAEGQLLNATKEVNFAVPTISQRGVFNTGATGVTVNPLTGAPAFDFPTTVSGDAIFSFFPFPNNPNGVYGENTFTQSIPNSAQGKILSGKVNGNFSALGKPQEFVARYNFTDDWRDIPTVGGALFSRVRSRVRTQNFSTFLNTQLSHTVLNQLRASYGRTKLRFDEGGDPEFLLPINRRFNNPNDAQFLLNTRFIVNDTLPSSTNVLYDTFAGFAPQCGLGTGQTETQCLGGPTANFNSLGPIGEIALAGFSPVGVDVFNFPQRRVNNTYQLADTATIQFGRHNFAFGGDTRRTELNSDLPRNARPLVTFNGAPRIVCANPPACTNLAFAANTGAPNPFILPQDFAAAGAPSGFFQSLVLPGRDSHINLRYYQLGFFAQDEWHVRPNFSLSFGLRYEYNTPPTETQQRIESTFATSLPSQVAGLRNFIGNRTDIFDPDRNNFAPRVGFAYSPHLLDNRTTVIRAGYGLYYDQILGAVVSQSRNVFPTFTTINFGGGCCSLSSTALDQGFGVFNPLRTSYFVPGTGFVPIIQPGTLNTVNPQLPQSVLLSTTLAFFPSGGTGRPFGATLPTQKLDMPMAHQYSVTVEQQVGRSMVLSAAYVGTMGRHLLRFTTPNLGLNYLVVPTAFTPGGSFFGGPTFSGITVEPGTITPSVTLTSGRPVSTIGPISQFETTAKSRYDALQLHLRGRSGFLGSSSQFQVAYTFGKVQDDVSDVFDLAGAPALPQDSRTFAGEYAPANFDVRHRLAYNYITDLTGWGKRNAFAHFIFDGLQMAGTGAFQTGQPFTINSIFDVNLDGNLTDRLNSTSGIQATGNRAQPYRLTGSSLALLAPVGTNGSVPRNSFRATNLWLTNVSVIKNFKFTESKGLLFRMDVFNFFNRANYGIPVRFLEAPGFGRSTYTVTPGRRIQFGLKFSF